MGYFKHIIVKIKLKSCYRVSFVETINSNNRGNIQDRLFQLAVQRALGRQERAEIVAAGTGIAVYIQALVAAVAAAATVAGIAELAQVLAAE